MELTCVAALTESGVCFHGAGVAALTVSGMCFHGAGVRGCTHRVWFVFPWSRHVWLHSQCLECVSMEPACVAALTVSGVCFHGAGVCGGVCFHGAGVAALSVWSVFPWSRRGCTHCDWSVFRCALQSFLSFPPGSVLFVSFPTSIILLFRSICRSFFHHTLLDSFTHKDPCDCLRM